jgi:hypothetical protein
MTEFTDLELADDVSDMEEDELRETLTDFMQAHEENREAYDSAKSQIDEIETEYQEKIEQYEEKIDEFKHERAKEAAEYANLPAELLAERFEFAELDQIIEEGEEAEEFSGSGEPEGEEDEEDERMTTFSEKKEKGRKESGGANRKRAAEKLRNKF